MSDFYNRVVKITPQSREDFKRLEYILTSKTFYPEPTSVPPRPGLYDNTFDYRQLFINMGLSPDRTGFLVYCREQIDVSSFNTSMVPILEWTDRYGLANAPIIEMYPYTDIVSGKRTMTGSYIFLSWDYQLYNNI